MTARISFQWYALLLKKEVVFSKRWDELKTVIHPDSESGLYCQQLNKRDSQSTVAEKLFLLNGYDISASDVEKVITFEKVGQGEMDQVALASWLRSRSKF